MVETHFFDRIYMFSGHHHRERQGTLPTLCRSNTFSSVTVSILVLNVFRVFYKHRTLIKLTLEATNGTHSEPNASRTHTPTLRQID
jgi:hypothetical protein